MILSGDKMTRREARKMAMQILYTCDFNKISLEQAIGFYDETSIEPEVLELVKIVIDNMDQIDTYISICLKNYTLDRLNLVDKAIIRLATGEILSGTDKRIAINEALEITKEFSDIGDHKAVAFNNRLLDEIDRKIKELKG